MHPLEPAVPGAGRGEAGLCSLLLAPWVFCTTGILPFRKNGRRAWAAGARGQAGGRWAAGGSVKPFGEPGTRVERWGQSEA